MKTLRFVTNWKRMRKLRYFRKLPDFRQMMTIITKNPRNRLKIREIQLRTSQLPPRQFNKLQWSWALLALGELEDGRWIRPQSLFWSVFFCWSSSLSFWRWSACENDRVSQFLLVDDWFNFRESGIHSRKSSAIRLIRTIPRHFNVPNGFHRRKSHFSVFSYDLLIA